MPIHNIYARLPQSIREEVDTAYTHAAGVLEEAGLYPANDDRAEKLVEAIAVYVLESRPELSDELLTLCAECGEPLTGGLHEHV